MRVPTDLGRMVYAGAYTASMSLVAVSKVALGDETAVQRITDEWSKNLAQRLGIEIAVYGQEHVDLGGPQVIMPNHQSLIDIPAMLLALPLQPAFLAKRELRRFPLFGRAVELGGHVFVDRQKHQSAVASIESAAEQVRNGKTVVIFPEGTRGAGTSILRMKKGGFHLAKHAGAPIVPVGIRGTSSILGKHGRRIRPGIAEVHIGEPIDRRVVEGMPLEELMALVRGRIAELSELPLAPASRDQIT
jgi:1-acyl-sn-glycerol-3-phosphate acyltransferase